MTAAFVTVAMSLIAAAAAIAPAIIGGPAQ